MLNGDRYANPGPSIYAYADMSINNQNVCASGTCDGTFYLAKVGPQFAGRTLVIEMYDAGDSTGAGTSTVYPMKPSPTATQAIGERPRGRLPVHGHARPERLHQHLGPQDPHRCAAGDHPHRTGQR